MVEGEQIVAERDDPNRCQSLAKGNQCVYLAVPGRKFCPKHVNHFTVNRENKESIYKFLRTEYQARHEQQANHSQLKSLNAEIGLLRMMLERQFNACTDDAQLLARQHTIIEYLRELGKLVPVLVRLDKDMGKVLDETQAKEWVQDIITILSNYVPDPDTLGSISNDMLDALQIRLGGAATAA